MLITSRTNPRIKDIKRLLRRRERDATGLFLAEGLQLVSEALRTRADITLLLLAPDLLNPADLAEVQGHRDIPTLHVTPEVLHSLSPTDGQHGIAAVVRQRWEPIEDITPAPGSCWVALTQIQHPGSLGTILRVSDSVGGAGVILIGDSTDPYDPTSVRASLGAIFSQRLARTTFPDFAAWKTRTKCPVVGTSPSARIDYRAASYPSPLVILMGGERIGLSPEHEALCDPIVRIPMAGRVESHHVAVAAALVLYEVLNQRSPGPAPPPP